MTTNRLQNIKKRTAKELLEAQFSPREMVVEPWLRTEETAVIWAASGVGKTMLSLSLALAVAGGGKVASWDCPKARKVIYVDGEMNEQDIRDRIVHLLHSGAVALSEPGVALDNLTIIARQGQKVGMPFYDITDKEGQDELLRIANRPGVGLLILDNFTTLTETLDDENDATQFKKVQDFFLQLKRVGVATILVHHSNKSGKQMRGSTALETTFEVVLGLKAPKIGQNGRASFVTEFTKFRGKGDGRLDPKHWTLGDRGWEVSDADPEDLDADPVLLALRSLNYVNQAEIAEKLGLNPSTVSRRIRKMEAIGVLKQGEAKKMFGHAEDLRSEEALVDQELTF